MLSVNDYNQLKILYDTYKKSSMLIRQLAESDDWDSIENAVIEKDALLRKIIFFEKPRISDIKDNTELIGIRNEIIEIEKANIVFINQLKDNLSREISGVKSKKKIYGAYEPLGQDSVSTFQINDIFEG